MMLKEHSVELSIKWLGSDLSLCIMLFVSFDIVYSLI